MHSHTRLQTRLAGAAAIALFAACAPLSFVQAQQAPAAAAAAKVDERYVWDLTTLYKDRAAWDAERKAIAAELPSLAALQGTLGKDAASLRTALDKLSAIRLRMNRLSVYMSTQFSTDARDQAAQEGSNLVRQLNADIGAATAWLDPEIQELGAEKVEAFIKADKGLEKHAVGLRDTLRMKAHTLGHETEAALAAVGPAMYNAGSTYQLLTSSDIDWPSVTLPDGSKVKVNQVGYSKLRENPDRAVRKLAFDTFWGKFGQYTNTDGSLLANRIQAGVAMAKLRNYPSAVAASLAANDIPESVYRTLVAEANKGLPTLHRYLKIRQKMLNLPDLNYYDIYPPIVELDRKFPIEEAKSLTLAATKPLGKEYARNLEEALKGRWMHVYPSDTKRPGAYQTGVYGVHPFVFLNHQDTFDSVSTFAHEWGHGMHTKLADAAQPYETSDYSLFVAEVASITNEVLLADYMQGRAKTREEKLFFLGHELDSIRSTFFRQTMFAEFELATHDAMERGEALSGRKMNEIYCDLLKRYHGDKEGVMKIDPAYCAEWQMVNHFYRPFYVYQYATSMAAAAYFGEQIGKGGEKERDRYLSVLKAGGSQYPYQLLKQAGVDLATPVPYQALIHRMDKIMDEVEKLLAEKK
ncbi:MULTISPECIES: oligoendopeptidase F [unclassified Azospirillum]|uniref:oligoendopeptidase F n=1 Tax=unclassified Azospirillum TaxID=2630922 RepID=UPI000B67F34B|nr:MULTISPECIES: oligoendopeptidase F [unclassified Azospirillum]SNS40597.1 oligoendopeptidase F [Azospirillum sp. RU38E]SNS59150.1 oligoendopeptidase F [Azospirillum sp. RU37A]